MDDQALMTAPSSLHCPHCWKPLAAEGSNANFCGECLALIAKDQADLTHVKKYHFNYTREGWFALISERRLSQCYEESVEGIALESFYIEITPLIDRLKSHLGWIFLLTSLFLGSWTFWIFFESPSLLPLFFPLFTAALMSSCLLIGYYWSALMMGGSFKPLFFPPPEEKIFRLCLQRKIGKAEDRMLRHQLQSHPGCLSNLALACFYSQEYARGWFYLDQALEKAPCHPALQLIANDFKAWKDQASIS